MGVARGDGVPPKRARAMRRPEQAECALERRCLQQKVVAQFFEHRRQFRVVERDQLLEAARDLSRPALQLDLELNEPFLVSLDGGLVARLARDLHLFEPRVRRRRLPGPHLAVARQALHLAVGHLRVAQRRHRLPLAARAGLHRLRRRQRGRVLLAAHARLQQLRKQSELRDERIRCRHPLLAARQRDRTKRQRAVAEALHGATVGDIGAQLLHRYVLAFHRGREERDADAMAPTAAAPGA
eukprot:6480929-Prymnesium_polylepis.2